MDVLLLFSVEGSLVLVIFAEIYVNLPNNQGSLGAPNELFCKIAVLQWVFC